MKFRKKPVVIEAIQWNGKNFDEVMNFMQEFHGSKINYENAEEAAHKTWQLFIDTKEGVMTASKNDWIIKGVAGEFYPCKPDIFEKTYEDASLLSESPSDGQDWIWTDELIMDMLYRKFPFGPEFTPLQKILNEFKEHNRNEKDKKH